MKSSYAVFISFIFVILILFQGVLAVESYEYVLQWGSHGYSDGQLNGPAGIAADSSGFIYVADSGNYRVQKFTPDGHYASQWRYCDADDGRILDLPLYIAVDSSDSVYVTNYLGRELQKFRSAGKCTAAWNFFKINNSLYDYPTGVAVDTSGFVYVVINHQIYKFTSGGSIIRKWGSSGKDDGQFMAPGGIAIDKSGNIFIADKMNHRIQKFNTDGTYLMQWGTNGSWDGQFNSPTDVAVDSAGFVYVADSGNNRIQKFSSDGTFITTWGSAGNGNGQFNEPDGIAIDTSGDVYVSDRYNSRIQKFSLKKHQDFQDSIPAETGPLPDRITGNATSSPSLKLSSLPAGVTTIMTSNSGLSSHAETNDTDRAKPVSTNIPSVVLIGIICIIFILVQGKKKF